MTGKRVRKYRRYTAQERAQMVAECEAPGVSVSQVARRHDVNANLLFRWRREARETITSSPAVDWLPVTVAPIAAEACVQIDLGNGHRLRLQGAVSEDLAERCLRVLLG